MLQFCRTSKVKGTSTRGTFSAILAGETKFCDFPFAYTLSMLQTPKINMRQHKNAKHITILTLTTLWADSADDILKYFFYFS